MIGKFSIFLAITAALLFAACERVPLYEQSHDLNSEQGWGYDNSYSFNFAIEDTSKSYELLLDLGHSREYKHENLYLQLTTAFPGGDTTRSPLSLELANKAGQWYGKCSGKYCHVSIPLQEKIHFQEPGNYALIFDQFMREPQVEGIGSIRLRLYEEEPQ